MSEDRLTSRGIGDVMGREDYFKLALHMHNGNPEHHFVMGWVKNPDDPPRWGKASRVELDTCIGSTWEAATEQQALPFAVVPYAQNYLRNESTWACFDIDMHEEDSTGIPVRYAVDRLGPQRDFVVLLREIESRDDLGTLAIIVESSGRGYHIFLVARKPRPCKEWLRLMKRICRSANVDLKEVDFFPASAGMKTGKGVRLPGSANPNTWNPALGEFKTSLILKTIGLKELVVQLPAFSELVTRQVSLVTSIEGGQKDKKNDHSGTGGGKLRASFPSCAVSLLNKNRIRGSRQRHQQLLNLVGEGIYVVARSVLRNLASTQYQEAEVVPKTDLDDHLQEFEAAFEGRWKNHVVPSLRASERRQFQSLRGEARRSAFIIMRDLARYNNGDEFFLSGKDLAHRLRIGVMTAYRIRNQFLEKGIIKMTRAADPPGGGGLAAYYRWQLPPEGLEPIGSILPHQSTT